MTDDDCLLGHGPEHHASKLKGLLWLIVGCLIAALFAFGLAPLAYVVPWRWEQSLGNAVNTRPDESCHATPEAKKLLQKLVARLYPLQTDDRHPIEVVVAKDAEINAYAQLGGLITLNSGLLEQAETPEEVAGVLAHEIAHVQGRHILQGAMLHLLTAGGFGYIFGDSTALAGWAHFFADLGFTRTQEKQADGDGLRRLKAAHIDNAGFIAFFKRLEAKDEDSFLSDHPANAARIDMARQFPNAAISPIMTATDWKQLQHYCGN